MGTVQPEQLRFHMEFILHIGLEKTGSSSLQKALVDNRKVLGRYGVAYPVTGISRPIRANKQKGLFMVLNGSAPGKVGMNEDWVERFHAETAGADICILSWEGLSWDGMIYYRPEAVTALLPRDRTKVVMYVREPVAHVASIYRQRVKGTNMTMKLREFARSSSHRPRYFTMAERWAAVFGRENVVIRLNARDCERWDIVSDFANLIGKKELCDALPSHVYKKNQGIAGNLLFVKRLLNFFITWEEAKAKSIRREMRELSFMDKTFRGNIPVDQETVDLVAHQFREDLEDLEKHYGVSVNPRQKPVESPPFPDLGNLGLDYSRILAFSREKNGKLAQLLERMDGLFT